MPSSSAKKTKGSAEPAAKSATQPARPPRPARSGMTRNALFAVALVSMFVSIYNVAQNSSSGFGHSLQVLVNTFTGKDTSLTAQPTCDSASGVCPIEMQESESQPSIPKGANAAGKPREASKDCLDRHKECKEFYQNGECYKNPGWMIINCPRSCNQQVNACAMRDPRLRCSRTSLNISTSPIYKNGYTEDGHYVNGDMNNMFESLVERFSKKHKVQVLSRDPWVVTFEDFTTAEEGRALIDSIQKWERSTDTGSMNDFGEAGRILSSGRTSTNGWCNQGCENHPLVKRVFSRIEGVTGVPRSHYESFQVLRYEKNQHYKVHHDYGAEDVNLACGPRILTLFLYLSDVEEGGETSFPQLGIQVKPKRGRALLWPSTLDHNMEHIEPRTTHEAKPVIKGTKFAANAWIHLYEYEKPNLWGCTGSFDEL